MSGSRNHLIWKTAKPSLQSHREMEVDWQRDKVLDNWDSAVQTAQTIILSSSTKLRLRFLHEELSWLVNERGWYTRL